MTIVSSKILFSFYSFLFLITFVSQAKAQPDFLYHFCINDNGNYTANSTYQNNLNTLLSNLTSNTQINYGFYNFSYGQNTDKVNAIGLCRGDVTPDVCRSCLNDSRILLTKRCPNQKEAIGWYDNCMLRYSNRSIFDNMEDSPTFYISNLNQNNVTDLFNRVLGNLMRKLKEIAASSDSRLKFAADNATDVNLNFQTIYGLKTIIIYGLLQCTPDLLEQDCNDCLERAISELPTCCNNKIGGRVVKPSCNIRYEPSPFYDSTTVIDQEETSPTEEEKSKSSHTIIVIVVPTVVVVALLIFICICLRKRKAKKNLEANIGKYDDEGEDEMVIADSLQYNFDIIRMATSDFSNSNKLGQGGFGIVYRGKLANGQMIAVKRLSTNSDQGDVEFKNEVLLVAKLQHRNLVRLLGFSIKGKERLLIYEFVSNKSLDFFIFDPTRKTQLNWEKRYNIIKGIARGLLYLHEDSRLRIIHRDLKASNILLDDEMNPKISDFGLARRFVIGQTQGSTNRIVGTYGYMAPEYAMHGDFSVKSDVYSFGVLVLEIISGHKNSANIFHGDDMEYLLSYAWRSWTEGRANEIIDSSLNNISQNEIMRCTHIGLLCIQENLIDRPTMASVALMLNSDSIALSIPSKPAYFIGSGTRRLPDMQLQIDNVGATRLDESMNQVSITDPYPR